MKSNISRRQLLKTGAFTAAGLAFTTAGRSMELIESENRTLSEGDMIWLDQNENPYGISKHAKKEILNSTNLSNRYPNEVRDVLVKMIAENEGISPENIFIGAGSAEALYTAAHLFGIDTGEVLYPDPTFHGFRNYLTRAAAKSVAVPLDENHEHDLEKMDRMINSRTSLTYVCNPNNPTGTIVNGAKLKPFVEEASKRSLVMVDEAYHELVDDSGYSSMMDFVRKGADVLVLRTFSKVHGLAGLRIGYGMARPDIIRAMKKVQGNGNAAGVLSLKAAIASYHDKDFINSSKKKNYETRSYFYTVLDKLGYYHIKSHTNFVMFKVDNADKYAKDLRKDNLVVKPFVLSGVNWIRVSLGTMDNMKVLAKSMEKLS